MSDLHDLGLYLEKEQLMDTIHSGNYVFQNILDEDTHLLVRISQSNSDLLSEFKGIKVSIESEDKHPKQEKSDGVHKIRESQSEDRGAHSLPKAQRLIP